MHYEVRAAETLVVALAGCMMQSKVEVTETEMLEPVELPPLAAVRGR